MDSKQFIKENDKDIHIHFSKDGIYLREDYVSKVMAEFAEYRSKTERKILKKRFDDEIERLNNIIVIYKRMNDRDSVGEVNMLKKQWQKALSILNMDNLSAEEIEEDCRNIPN